MVLPGLAWGTLWIRNNLEKIRQSNRINTKLKSEPETLPNLELSGNSKK